MFHSSYEGSQAHSLYGVINCTKTAMGARLLYERLARPIQDRLLLEERLSHIQYFVDTLHERSSLLSVLSGVSDIPRLVSKILYRKPSAQSVQQFMLLCASLFSGDTSALLISSLQRVGLSDEHLASVRGLLDQLQRVFVDEILLQETHYIRPGYSEVIDELTRVAYNSDELLLQYQQDLIEHTQ